MAATQRKRVGVCLLQFLAWYMSGIVTVLAQEGSFKIPRHEHSSNSMQDTSANINVQETSLNITSQESSPNITIRKIISNISSQESSPIINTTVPYNDRCLLQEGLVQLRECRVKVVSSCRNKCGQRVTGLSRISSVRDREQHCACDQFCKLFRDCCVDFETECPDITTASHQWNSSGFNVAVDYTLKCDFVGGFPNRLNQFLMISTCPSTWNGDGTRQACENDNSLQLLDFLPVTHIASGLHFRNIHCSKCHGLVSGVELWSMSLMCSSVDPASMVTQGGLDSSALMDTKCQFFFDSKHASQPRRCRGYVSTCHPDCQGNIVVYYIPIIDTALIPLI
jgi:hypothetical protein